MIVRTLLLAAYGLAVALSRAARLARPRRARDAPRRVMLIGAFHNSGWYLSHVRPLAMSGLAEVIVVADGPQPALPRVRVVCPPAWARAVFGRATAKLIWATATALRARTDVVMGYHLFPGAWSALLAARLAGCVAGYQMTAGPVEVLGGGHLNENRLMRGLGRASPMVERLAKRLLNEFDLVVVRGRQAAGFVRGFTTRPLVEIVPGSVVAEAQRPGQDVDRSIDLVFVGRLSEYKQPGQFVRIVAAVWRTFPGVRAAVIGEGDQRAALERDAAALGLAGRIEFAGRRDDVESWLRRSKLFVLTSRGEGLSIAMCEAMACGVVPVVANVGELGDVVAHGRTGFLVAPGDIEGFVAACIRLLEDPRERERVARAAQVAATAYTGVEAVAQRWQAVLEAAAGHGACAVALSRALPSGSGVGRGFSRPERGVAAAVEPIRSAHE